MRVTSTDVGPPEPSRNSDVRVLPRLSASWQRSRAYGVPVDVVEANFTGTLDTDSLLYECGTEVLRGLHGALANEPVSLMVADRDGLVLNRLCNDKAIQRSLDKVYLAPGFVYSEKSAGTNGLGLSLADRSPTLVRADEHYCTALRGYTCAAAPVLDGHGTVMGTINLTTWARSSEALLLALAQSAAGSTSAMMQVRAGGGVPLAPPRGEVFHVWTHRAETDDACRSSAWRGAQHDTEAALRAGHVVLVVGEAGTGKNTLVSLAHRAVSHRERVLTARVPDASEIEHWASLWTPELGVRDTCIIVSGVDSLPAWSANGIAAALSAARRESGPQPFVLTAADYAAVAPALVDLVDTVVRLEPLRERASDVWPLAAHFARAERRRDVTFTPAARRALHNHGWPGNAAELGRVVKAAVGRADVVDARHLDAGLFGGAAHRLTRMETVERDEIVRALLAPDATVGGAAAELGMSRATVYRKIAQYGIRLPHR